MNESEYRKIVDSLPKPETVEEQYLYGLVCTVAEQPNKYGAKENPFKRMEQYWKAFRDVTAARALEPNVPSENTVSTNTIQGSAIVTNKLADSSVTTVKIADNNVTTEKLDSLVESRLLGNNRVTTAMVQNRAITPSKLAEDYTTEAEVRSLIDTYATGEMNKIEIVQKNGTALAITNKTVNVTVPTKTSELTNDSGFITGISGLATVATTGSYNDLSDKPTIPAAVTDSHINDLIDAKLGVIENGTY